MHVWSMRTRLQLVEDRKRDLALFNLAIDSKLRGCDVVSVRVEDIAPRGYAVDRATVRQKKTWHPVKFELTEQTRHALGDYMKAYRPSGRRHVADYQAICAAGFGMGRQHRT
jgi:integrase